MTVKEKVLALLERRRGAYLSGEEIAAQLQVTRSAVWKAMQALKAEGYRIEGVTNKGYSLSPETDVLAAAGVQRYLTDDGGRLRLQVYKTIGSTNDAVKQLAVKGEAEGAVVLAEEQTGGHGQRGRSFFSPSATGLYMSLLLRPSYAAAASALLTTAAAVSVAQAIEEVSGKPTQIKWVNDIWMNGKKVCGILTEASLSLESGGVDFAVLGIGVNVIAPKEGFPPELASLAAAVFAAGEQPADARNRLAAGILTHFLAYYDHLEERCFLPEYRKRLFFLGRPITVLRGTIAEEAVALDVDRDCHLQVRFADGHTQWLSGGEIRIKI